MRTMIVSWLAACAALLLLGAGPVWADARRDYAAGVAAHERGDVIAAVELLRRAVEQGHVPAMVRLAYVLDQSEDNAAAFALYRRAAEAGSAEAALAVGVMYGRGEGVEQDVRQALAWITRAAEAGHGPAIVTLAQVHLRGEMGTAPSREQALDWLARGVAAGYDPARQELERLRAGASGQPAR